MATNKKKLCLAWSFFCYLLFFDLFCWR